MTMFEFHLDADNNNNNNNNNNNKKKLSNTFINEGAY